MLWTTHVEGRGERHREERNGQENRETGCRREGLLWRLGGTMLGTDGKDGVRWVDLWGGEGGL